MIAALIIVGSILVYALGFGFTFVYNYKRLSRWDVDRYGNIKEANSYNSEIGLGSFLVAACWPCGLPAIWAYSAAMKLVKPPKHIMDEAAKKRLEHLERELGVR